MCIVQLQAAAGCARLNDLQSGMARDSFSETLLHETSWLTSHCTRAGWCACWNGAVSRNVLSELLPGDLVNISCEWEFLRAASRLHPVLLPGGASLKITGMHHQIQ